MAELDHSDTDMPPPIPPENFPGPDADQRLTDEKRSLDAYKKSFAYVVNGTGQEICVSFAFVPHEKEETDASPYRHWGTPRLKSGQTYEKVLENAGGYYFPQIFADDKWHMVVDWVDFSVVPARWVIISKTDKTFQLAVSFQEPQQ